MASLQEGKRDSVEEEAPCDEDLMEECIAQHGRGAVIQ